MSDELILRLPFDSPWRRLPFVLPLAVGLCALALFAFLSVLGRVAQPAAAPQPIEARIVVIPPAPQPVAPLPPAPLEHEIRHAPPRTVHRLAPRPKATTPAQVPVEHTPPAPAAPAQAPAPAVAAAAGTAPRAGALGGDRMSARAIFKPMPQIPDELRRRALHTVAVVRFEVAADGSAKAALLRPTPLPQLNLLLLQAFGRWRFFPALQDGKPVPSVIDLSVPVRIE
ncbi:MAG TPA: energy transducer TonB [Burkholderiales bacterium]|nr:energy transducer TonB [Burkholderiales bacterium]